MERLAAGALIEGVDYAFSRPSAAALVAAGKKFAVRYGGPGSSSKQLDAVELAALRGHGIAVVANAEGAAGGFRGTTAGRSWARQAEDHFGALGMPSDRPIYFSVDWDAGPSDWASIDAAFGGAAGVIGAARVGVYGGFDTIAHCVNAGTARWFWQTYAWSNGKWHPRCHLQQYRNGVTIDGGDCDLDRAMVADYGQWNFKEEVPDMELTDKYGDQAWPNRTVANRLKDDAMLRDVLWGDATGAKVANLNPNSPLGKLIAVPDQLAAFGSRLTALEAAVTALQGGEQPVITKEQLQAAFVAALEELASRA